MVAAIEHTFPEILADYCRTRLGIVPGQQAKRPWQLNMLSFPWPVLDRLFLSKDDIKGTQSLMPEVLRAAKQPLADWSKAFYDLSQEQMRNQMWPFGQKFPFYGRIVGREVPMWINVADDTLNTSIRRVLLRIAVGSTRFQAREGRWPNMVEELFPTDLPGVPLDPFNQHSLRIRTDGDSIVIYSVGPNGVDDGGLDDDQQVDDKRDDITFRIGLRHNR